MGRAAASELMVERDSWEARCHFCGGPSYPWLTTDETWALVEPILGQQQSCFECFVAAYYLAGHTLAEPFQIRTHGEAARLAATEEALRRFLVFDFRVTQWLMAAEGGALTDSDSNELRGVPAGVIDDLIAFQKAARAVLASSTGQPTDAEGGG